MLNPIAGAITKEALVMAGWGLVIHEDWKTDRYEKDGIVVIFSVYDVPAIHAIGSDGAWEIRAFAPPITTMARLMDEIEAFEESLKPKEQQQPEPIALCAEQFISQGWQRTSMGGAFTKQGMYAVTYDNDRMVHLFVGDNESQHTTMQSVKAHILGLVNAKYNWLL